MEGPEKGVGGVFRAWPGSRGPAQRNMDFPFQFHCNCVGFPVWFLASGDGGQKEMAKVGQNGGWP